MSAAERLDELAALLAAGFVRLKCRKGHPPTGDIGRTAGAFRGTTRSGTLHDKPGTLGEPGANARRLSCREAALAGSMPILRTHAVAAPLPALHKNKSECTHFAVDRAAGRS